MGSCTQLIQDGAPGHQQLHGADQQLHVQRGQVVHVPDHELPWPGILHPDSAGGSGHLMETPQLATYGQSGHCHDEYGGSGRKRTTSTASTTLDSSTTVENPLIHIQFIYVTILSIFFNYFI